MGPSERMSEHAPEERRALAVDEEGGGMRADQYLSDYLDDVSRSQVQRLIREGQVLIDGRPCKPSTPLKEGAVLTWPADAGIRSISVVPEPLPLQVLFEDDDLLVLNKPAGLVVHPAPGNWTGTLVHGLLHRWPGWTAPGGPLRPGIVHRLDKGTSGLLVVARSPRAYASLREQIASHSPERAYMALVWGTPAGERGSIEQPIGRDPRYRQRMAVVSKGGRPAVTLWQRLVQFDSCALLRVTLRTGRTHQVRVHLASIGHPVFGDPLYGGLDVASRLSPRDRPRAHGLLRMIGRQALHAYRLVFEHPADGESLVFEAPVPRDMERVLLQLMESGGKQ